MHAAARAHSFLVTATGAAGWLQHLLLSGCTGKRAAPVQLILLVTFLGLHGYMVFCAGREGAKVISERRVNPLRILQRGGVCVSAEAELALQNRYRALQQLLQAAQAVAVQLIAGVQAAQAEFCPQKYASLGALGPTV